METFEIALNSDIDTAYNRIKREFGFKTRAERIKADPRVKGWLKVTLDFRYQSTPGVHYLMRGYKKHSYKNEESPNTIQVELFKGGKNKVDVVVSFYSGNTTDITGYKQSIARRISKAVNR